MDKVSHAAQPGRGPSGSSLEDPGRRCLGPRFGMKIEPKRQLDILVNLIPEHGFRGLEQPLALQRNTNHAFDERRRNVAAMQPVPLINYEAD